MPNVPEYDLQHVFSRLLEATSTNSKTRKTAVRWFNRLYFDVRRWNQTFIEFLKTYPGFSDRSTAQEYSAYLVKLGEYRESLEERYGTVKNELCTSLKILSARYPRDFDWLYKENEQLYHEIRSLVDDSYATEMQIIRIAHSVCEFLWHLSSEDENWHVQHHDQVVNRITEYECESKEAVVRLQETADSVGIHLLDIAEYEEILNTEGSNNPNVMVVGEITMSRDNIHIDHVVGPVNIKSRLNAVQQTVNNAPSLPDAQKAEFRNLLDELKTALQSVAERRPEDGERVVQAAEMVATEMAKSKPNTGFLKITAEGLKEAAKAVGDIAPTVLSAATKIATFVSALL